MSKRLRYAVETLLVNALVLSSLYQLLVYLANRRFWQRVPPEPPADTPSVSVVVPLRGKTLDTLALLHVMAITRPTAQYELLMVVESADDPAHALAEEIAAAYPEARVILSGSAGDHIGKAHNLNAGYQAGAGDLIAFVDADVHVSAELWSAALGMLAESEVGAVFAPPLVSEPEQRGTSRVPTGGEMLVALHTNHARSAELPFTGLSGRVTAMRSGFMVVRRQALNEAGGMLHLLNDTAPGIELGRAVRELGYQVEMLPVPARVVPAAETFNEAISHLLRKLIVHRAYSADTFLAWPFTNPLTMGFLLGFITEREGRWWGRRTWWAFVWLRMAIAYELDRLRFGRAWNWVAYAQLFMLDTFIAPTLWARALVQRTFTWRGRRYRIAQGGKTRRLD